MKLIRVKKKDIQFEKKSPEQAQKVFLHLSEEYKKLDKDLRSMSELIHLLTGANPSHRQELAKKLVAMADSMKAPWKGIENEFNSLWKK